MIDEDYYEIEPVVANFAVAWTGYVWRILERVTESGAFITWPQGFSRREDAKRYLMAELERWKRQAREGR